MNESKPIHFAFFSKGIIQQILNGEKTIESRFSKNQIVPYQRINTDDIVFMRETGASKNKPPICAFGIVQEVKFFEFGKGVSVNDVKFVYGDKIKAPKEFWKAKQTANYATLIYFKEVHQLDDVKVPD